MSLFPDIFTRTAANAQVNTFGVVRTVRAFTPLLRASGPGARVVNVSSVRGKVAGRRSGVYAASKFAMEALSDCLRLELAPWRIGCVRVHPA